jgi:predicted amidohydrolase
MKFAPTIDENLAAIERRLADATRQRADAVLLPECTTAPWPSAVWMAIELLTICEPGT